jgi:hypothetical protein
MGIIKIIVTSLQQTDSVNVSGQIILSYDMIGLNIYALSG